jgi:glycosyltransferase involved in cell wall biosynthesis
VTASSPVVSVVIATMNRPTLLVQCIEAIVAGDLADFEVLTVDQGRDESTRQAIEARFGADRRIRYLHSDIVGSSHARNVGIAGSTGAIVAFVDDDAIPVPSWLSAYVEAFREIRPAPGLVGGRITLAWDGPCPGWYPEACKFILGTYDIGDQVREFPPGDLPISANFALRRDALPAGEAFDIGLGFSPSAHGLLAAEDSLLALRVLSGGGRLYYHPRAHVRHLVTAHKLSRRYFLRRFYWHGRAVVKLKGRPGGESRSWLRMWMDRRRKGREAPAAPVVSRPSLQARIMQLAAHAALATGVVVEAVSARRGEGP